MLRHDYSSPITPMPLRACCFRHAAMRFMRALRCACLLRVERCHAADDYAPLSRLRLPPLRRHAG